MPKRKEGKSQPSKTSKKLKVGAENSSPVLPAAPVAISANMVENSRAFGEKLKAGGWVIQDSSFGDVIIGRPGAIGPNGLTTFLSGCSKELRVSKDQWGAVFNSAHIHRDGACDVGETVYDLVAEFLNECKVDLNGSNVGHTTVIPIHAQRGASGSQAAKRPRRAKK